MEPSCGIIFTMDARDLLARHGQRSTTQGIPGRPIGLTGRLSRPFWGALAIWSALCGATASSQLRLAGESVLTLALVLILVALAWGNIWDLLMGTAWRRLLAGSWASAQPSGLRGLPYTLPGSAGGRLAWGLSRSGVWWRDRFWPAVGPEVLGILASAVLAVVLSLLLPTPVRWLNAILALLLFLGVLMRWRGNVPLLGQSLALVGLSWIAAHLTFADLAWPSMVLALCFSIAVWGILRVSQGLPRGLWMLNCGQVLVMGLLIVLKQPLAAGAVGLLWFALVALQASVRSDTAFGNITKRTWPWLMASMLVAALALP